MEAKILLFFGMIWLPSILAIAFLTVIYHATRFFTSYFLGIYHEHYIIGFKPRLFDFKFLKVKFSAGIFIPLPWIGKPNRFINGAEVPFNYTWEMLEKPALKRLFITISGIISLLLTAIIVMIVTTYLNPITYVSKEEINKYGIAPSELAEWYGFKLHDRVLAINGEDFDYYDLNNPELYLDSSTTYTILRDGKEQQIQVRSTSKYPADLIFLSIAAPFEVWSVSANSGAERAGIMKGDRISSINGIPIATYFDIPKVLADVEDGEVAVEVQRLYDGKFERLEKNVTVDKFHRIGIFTREIVETTVRQYSLSESIVIGFKNAFNVAWVQIKAFAIIIKGNIAPSRSLSGPIGISHAYGDFWNGFWRFVVLYAMLFGVFWNLLPLPGSAFWEFFPLVYESITRKRINHDKFARILKATRVIFLWVVGGVFAWIIVSDIIKLF